MNLRAYILPISFILLAIVIGVLGNKQSSLSDQASIPETSEQTPPPLPNKTSKQAYTNGEEDLTSDETSTQTDQTEKPSQGVSNPTPFEIPNEKILTFASIEDLEAFLKSAAADSLQILGRSNQLLSLRVRGQQLGRLAESSIPFESTPNFFVNPSPTPEPGSVQSNAVGVGQSLLEILGITSDNSTWGEGVTVAVIDSGITPHPSLSEFQTILNFTPEGEFNGHATGVASVIAGQSDIAPGIAPASTLISIPITDQTGSSNSFALAEGIFAAVDAGAQILNISLGSYGDSNLVAQAVDYAFQNGAVVVASSGNEGLEFSAYPSAYSGVISVGAVDATGSHLLFSNASEDLSLTAPGFQINTAWSDESFIQASGTSFSAPAVSGAISAVLSSNPDLSPREAADVVLDNTNEGGQPGPDALLGTGLLDVGRAINFNTPNIVDPAVASHFIAPADSSSPRDQVIVTIQNQGTTELNGVPLSVKTDSGQHELQSGLILPGQIETFHLPINFVPLINGGSVQIQSQIGAFRNDSQPNNNGLTTTLTLPEANQEETNPSP